MSEENIYKLIEKLQWQIKTVAEETLLLTDAKLVVKYDWDKSTLTKVYDAFDSCRSSLKMIQLPHDIFSGSPTEKSQEELDKDSAEIAAWLESDLIRILDPDDLNSWDMENYGTYDLSVMIEDIVRTFYAQDRWEEVCLVYAKLKKYEHMFKNNIY